MYANQKDEKDESRSPEGGSNDGVSRRGILQSFLGGAIGMVAGDMLLNTAMTTATSAGGAAASTIAAAFRKVDFQRVLRFGTQYEASGAIASEELLSWVAAQKTVTAFPEIKAWMAAQQKLQTMRRVATTTAAATGATEIGLEEGIVVAAVGKAVKEMLSSDANDIDDVTSNTTLAISTESKNQEERANKTETSEATDF